MSEMKRWRLVVNYKDAKEHEEDWCEEYTVDYPPERIIERFNKTLRPGEREREVIAAIELEEVSQIPHSWKKRSLVTEISNGNMFDRYKCEVCGITAKRFGLGSTIEIDKKFKAKKYKYCQKERTSI